ncbi:hypothetical protein [Streptomyces sp. NPDC057623]
MNRRTHRAGAARHCTGSLLRLGVYAAVGFLLALPFTARMSP